MGRRCRWVCLTMVVASCGPTGEDPPRVDPVVVEEPDSPGTTIPTAGTLRPFDEGVRDTAFVSFRHRLLGAVAARDTSALLAVVSPDIRVSFGADNGIDAFREQWGLSKGDTTIWVVLGDVLRHGGRFTGPDFFIAPYTFFLPDSIDAFTHVVVRDSAVLVRRAPAPGAMVIGQLSHAIVEVAREPAPDGWVAIIADSGVAFVHANEARSPVGYRAGFQRVNGAWQLVFLAAGD